MANTLTDLIPDLYAALDIVSREITGMISSVAVNTAPTSAAKDEVIRIPVTPSVEAYDIAPAVTAPDNGDQTINNVNMKITKSRMVPVRWDGEEQLGVRNSGTYNSILVNQFAQAMRVLCNEIESDLTGVYIGASRAYGEAGKTPFAENIGETAQMRKILLDNGAPMTDLQLVIDSTAGANLRSLGQLTKVNESGTEAGLRRGELLNVNGFSIRESGQIATHVAGDATGCLVNNSSGYKFGDVSIAYDTGSGNFKAGDLVTFGEDKTMYCVSEDKSATPLMLAKPGLLAAVADDAAITLAKRYKANLAFDRNAIQLIARVPAMPQGGDSADDVTTITDPVSGLSFQVAVYRQYRQTKYEIGIAWGVKLIKPEHVAILVG